MSREAKRHTRTHTQRERQIEKPWPGQHRQPTIANNKPAHSRRKAYIKSEQSARTQYARNVDKKFVISEISIPFQQKLMKYCMQPDSLTYNHTYTSTHASVCAMVLPLCRRIVALCFILLLRAWNAYNPTRIYLLIYCFF